LSLEGAEMQRARRKGGFADASLPPRGTFDRRLKSTQKRWSLAKAPACGGSPALLGPGGGRSTHSANASFRHTLPFVRPALRCSVPSRLERQNRRDQDRWYRSRGLRPGIVRVGQDQHILPRPTPLAPKGGASNGMLRLLLTWP